MEEKHPSSKLDKIKVGNNRKLFIKENGVKGAYSFMKPPYHQFHRDYQPDGMHTVTDVIKMVINWLTGNVDINKLPQAEEEFKSVRPEKIADKIVTLTVKEKTIGNHRRLGIIGIIEVPQRFFWFFWRRFHESHDDTEKHTWMD